MTDSMSAASARRTALAAQGFARPRPATVGTRQLASAIDRLGLVQLDSVNVFERSHYLPLFARLGAFDRALLDRLTFAKTARYTEYWAHEAALIPVDTWPLLRWRMDDRRAKDDADESSWSRANGPMLDWLRAEIADKGPLTVREVEHDATARRGPWWGWSDVKIGLEKLFAWGELVSAGRSRFERRYALPEQALPPAVIAARVDRADAQRALVERGALAHGVGTAGDLADYFRMPVAATLAAIRDLVDDGILLPTAVEGWKASAWRHRDARTPRRVDAVALLSPFDPVVWARPRAERLFDFHYRIEIYTPAPQRKFGYYSLPLLVDDDVVGRIDLKSDRQNGVLLVQSAWVEEGAPADTAERAVPRLLEAAAWQGLERVEVVGRGSLAPGLAGVLASSGGAR
ncbi:winged helix-turn-helix domain-containing protein [Marisediminicola sp. LYQ134]|uniref:winged helix-turn-helix domain-containing protein n=1 Tax=Marisediminicola sp. LYQ134 TaxID=3391061 RepID=UPI0039835C20